MFFVVALAQHQASLSFPSAFRSRVHQTSLSAPGPAKDQCTKSLERFLDVSFCADNTHVDQQIHALSHDLPLFPFLPVLCSDFSENYGSYKRAVDLLAVVDCLLSFATVAKIPGYTW